MAPVETLSFTCAVIIGGSGGIGKAIARKLITAGRQVILVDRAASPLRQVAEELQATASFVLDTADISYIPHFVAEVLQGHPEVDCLVNAAGTQKSPQAVVGSSSAERDRMNTGYGFVLEAWDEELDVNVRAPVHLAQAFVPHFNNLPPRRYGDRGHDVGAAGVIMNVAPALDFLPRTTSTPTSSASGARGYIHNWTADLRAQLAAAGSRIKVVEIATLPSLSPLGTGAPDHVSDDSGEVGEATEMARGLELEESVEELWEGWTKNKDLCTLGRLERQGGD